MKTYFKSIAIAVLAALAVTTAVSVVAPIHAHADTVAAASVAAPAGYEWIGAAVAFLQNMPAVGQYLAAIFSIIALISAVMTFISVAVHGVLTAPAVLARWAGASSIAAKIDAVTAKVLPWLQYLSMFNVQKK